MDSKRQTGLRNSSLEDLVDEVERLSQELAELCSDHGRVLRDFDQVIGAIDTSLCNGGVPAAEQLEAERLAADLQHLEAKALLLLKSLERSLSAGAA